MVLKFIARYTDMSEYKFDMWLAEDKTLLELWEAAADKAMSERPFMEGMVSLSFIGAEIRSGN